MSKPVFYSSVNVQSCNFSQPRWGSQSAYGEEPVHGKNFAHCELVLGFDAAVTNLLWFCYYMYVRTCIGCAVVLYDSTENDALGWYAYKTPGVSASSRKAREAREASYSAFCVV